MTFINEYCKKYGAECIAATEHNDEKTKHWHIFLQITTALTMLALGERKKEMSEYGKELQDMSADAFSHIAVRGLRGSNAVHRKLKLMHKIEQEFKDQQELVVKTGQRDYSNKKSAYCYKNKALTSLSELVRLSKSKYIVVSCSDEGIIPKNEIIKILEKKVTHQYIHWIAGDLEQSAIIRIDIIKNAMIELWKIYLF